MNKEIFEIIKNIPVVNFVPALITMLNAFPKAWDEIGEEKKKEIATNLIMAASKAAADYANK